MHTQIYVHVEQIFKETLSRNLSIHVLHVCLYRCVSIDVCLVCWAGCIAVFSIDVCLYRCVSIDVSL